MKLKRIVFLLALFLSSLNLCLAEEEVIFIDVEEISDEVGVVSTQAKQFQLSIDYREDLIDNGESFSASDSVFLERLNIISRSLDRKKKNPKSVLGDYSFTLMEQGDSAITGFKKLVYLSNEQVIKKSSRLNFKIDINDYLVDQNIESEGLITKANKKIDIKALDLSFSNISFTETELAFSKVKEKKKSKINSTDFIVRAQVGSTDNLTNIIKFIKFNSESDNGKKIKAKIKTDGSNKKLNMKVIDDEIGVSLVGDNLYEFSIPMSLRSRKALSESKIEKLSEYDTVIVPITIVNKSGDNLDVRISGILRKQLSIVASNGTTSADDI